LTDAIVGRADAPKAALTAGKGIEPLDAVRRARAGLRGAGPTALAVAERTDHHRGTKHPTIHSQQLPTFGTPEQESQCD
jgi:hypothetical protein